MAKDQRKSGTKSVSKLRTVEDFIDLKDSLEKGRGSLEQQWKLNLAFYKGRQYSYKNPRNFSLESLPTEDPYVPQNRVRLVSNQIITGTHSLLAKLTRAKPVITASPGSGSDSDVKAAQMSEHLLEYWWDEMDLDSKLEEALLWAIIAGQGYWKVTWDPHAGKAMKFTVDPDGRPILNDALKDLYLGGLAEAGLPPQEQTVFMGDIRVEALSPFDVLLDPTATVYEDAKFVICRHHLSPDEIKTRWGADVEADAIPTTPDAELPLGGQFSMASDKMVKVVYIGYFKPHPALPEGKYVVWCEGAGKELLMDKKWNLPHNNLPIVKFPGLRLPGSVYDESPTTQAIPIQKQVNRIMSQVVEHQNAMLKPQWWAPVGSVRTRPTNEPGAINEYVPYGNFRPEPVAMPGIPPYVFTHLGILSAKIREIYGLTEIGDGGVPGAVNAGVAIDILQEVSLDRFKPTIKLMEQALQRAGGQMLTLAHTFYIEPRMLKIRGSGSSTEVRRFTQADIGSGVDVHVEAGSGIPHTRAGRQARIESLVSMGVLRPEQAWKHFEIGDMKSLGRQWAMDEEQAGREHEKIIQGKPLNPAHLQQAFQTLQEGINPETGQPLQTPDEAQIAMERAAVWPSQTENLGAHQQIHANFTKSQEFEGLPIEVQERFFTHYQITTQLSEQIPQPEPLAPKVNLQIKSTASPATQQKILNQAGVPVSPEDTLDPPLLSWVSDSVDKPDIDSDGPGQSGNELIDKMRKQEMFEEDLKGKMIKNEEGLAKANKARREASNA